MSAMTTTTTATVAPAANRSWAQIVNGSESANDQTTPKALKPGARGSLLCRCRGELLTMLTHYGWIIVFGAIDHPCAEQHQGHIYVSKKDLVKEKLPVAGDIVSFYLYADEKGLGAEECSVEESDFDSDSALSEITEVASETQSIANSFTSSDDDIENETAANENSVNDFKAVVSRLSQVFANYDEEDDDDQEVDDFITPRMSKEILNGFSSDDEDDSSDCMETSFFAGSENFTDDDPMSSCDESVDVSFMDYNIQGHTRTKARTSMAVRSLKGNRALSPDGSTSAGSTSDSDGECSCDALPIRTRTAPPNFRPPPGLDHPLGWDFQS